MSLNRPTLPESLVQRATPAPVRRLWQVPVLAIGVVALVLSLRSMNKELPTPARLVSERSAAALEALERGDLEEAIAVAEQALPLAADAPRHAGDIRFVLGSAHLRKARDLSGPAREREVHLAHVYLRQAAELGVSGPHESRLSYRLLLARLHSGADPQAVALELERALLRSPVDREEGYPILIELHLNKKGGPDVESALAVNERLLAHPDLSNPNPARLQRAELLLMRKRTQEARQVLERVSSHAKEAAMARHLRALSFWHEQDYAGALSLWEEGGLSASSAYAASLYFMGCCYLQLERYEEAADSWAILIERFPASVESNGGRLQLAELRRQQGQDAEAIRLFEEALGALNRETYDGRLLDLPAACQLVEAGWFGWMESGRFENARRLACVYRSLALPGEAEQRQGLAAQAWGLKLSTPPRVPQRTEEARKLFLEAAEAFEASAAARSASPEHGDQTPKVLPFLLPELQ